MMRTSQAGIINLMLNYIFIHQVPYVKVSVEVGLHLGQMCPGCHGVFPMAYHTTV